MLVWLDCAGGQWGVVGEEISEAVDFTYERPLRGFGGILGGATWLCMCLRWTRQSQSKKLEKVGER